MTHIFTHDRQTVSPMSERRLIHLNIPDWHTDVTLQNGVRDRKESLNPLGFDRMDPNIRGLDQMIQATQQEYELRQNMGEDTRRTQLYSIQKLWQDDYNMQVSDNFPSGNSLKIDKRSWLDAANAELADKGASYRLSIINDTVLPKPAPKVPKVKEAPPAAEAYSDDDGEKPDEDVPSTVDAPAPIRVPFTDPERLEITSRANDMLKNAGWTNLSGAERKALVNSIKMTTGANVDLTDPEAPILSAPKDRYERYANMLQGMRDSADESFIDDTGNIGPKPAPKIKYDDNFKNIKRVVDLDNPEMDLELLNSFAKGTKDTMALIKRSKKEVARLEEVVRTNPTPELQAELKEQSDLLEDLKTILVSYQNSAQIFQDLVKEREEGKEEKDALAKLDPDNKEIMEKVQKGDLSGVNRLKELNVPLARMLIRVNRYLPLNGITELTPEVASVLGGHSHYVMLDGLNKIDAPVARGLSGIKASLDLNGLVEIDEAVALELAKHSFKLELNGVITMDDSAAKALAGHKGDIYLNSLKSLPSTALGELIKNAGSLTLGIGPSIDLSTAEVLATHNGYLSLPGVTSLGTAEAQALGKREGNLSLGLTSITPEVATALTATNTNSLSLNSLPSLHKDIVTILATHKGLLSLDGVQSIDDKDTAMALATREESLILDGLLNITPEIATALFADHPQRISLQRLSYATLTPEVIQILADNRDHINFFGLFFRDKPEFKAAIDGKWSLSQKILASPDTAAGAANLEAGKIELAAEAILNDIASIKTRADRADMINGINWYLNTNPNIADGTPDGIRIRPKLEELKSKL